MWQSTPTLGRIYWANFLDNTIRGAPLDGHGTADILYGPADGVNGPGGVAIDPTDRIISIIDTSRAISPGSMVQSGRAGLTTGSTKAMAGSEGTRLGGSIGPINNDNTIRGASTRRPAAPSTSFTAARAGQ